MSPLLGVFLFCTILLLIGFRPRKPRVVHAHMNNIFFKVFISVELALGSGLGWMGWSAIDRSLRKVGFVGLLISILPGILMMIYFLYWSQPFSRKKTGVRAVDEAVEQYRKPGERAVGIIGGWSPDLVVGGKAYKMFVYAPEDANIDTGSLALDLEGKAVTDPAIVKKVAQCLALAGQFANPENINARTSNYTIGARSLKALDPLMEKYDSITAPLREIVGKDLPKHLEKVRAAMHYLRRDFVMTMEYLEYEAAYGNRQGNTQIRSVRHEDVVEMNQTWRGKNHWQLDAVEQAQAGVQSAKELLRLMKRKDGVVGEVSGLKEILGMVTSYEENLHSVEGWKAAGGVQDRYTGLDEKQLESWRSRLEWVKQVDGWIAQGLSGDGLEKMKEKHDKGKG